MSKFTYNRRNTHIISSVYLDSVSSVLARTITLKAVPYVTAVTFSELCVICHWPSNSSPHNRKFGQKIVDLCQVIFSQLDDCSILSDPSFRASTWNGDDLWISFPLRLASQPINRELCWCTTFPLCKSLKSLDELCICIEVIGLEPRATPKSSFFRKVFE